MSSKSSRGKILITGGAGYIGSHTVKHLLEHGYEVVVFDNLSTGSEMLVDKRALLMTDDLKDFSAINRVIATENFQGAIHFAASVEVPLSVREPLAFYENNLVSGLNLLKACKEHGLKNLVFSSTAAVYSDPGEDIVNEDSLKEPQTPYGKSKLWFENIIKDYSYVSELRYVILRYFNVGGASSDLSTGQWGRHHSALIKRVAQLAAGVSQEFGIYGNDFSTKDGTGVRDYIHVEDMAEVHRLAVEHLLAGNKSETMNVGYGKGYSVREVVSTMEKICGKNLDVDVYPRREGDLGQVIADPRKLRQTLNWNPKYADLEKICRSAYEWELKMMRAQ